MAEEATRLPVKTAEREAERAPVPRGWPPMESIRRDLNRLFEDFGDLLPKGRLFAEARRRPHDVGNLARQGRACHHQSQGV